MTPSSLILAGKLYQIGSSNVIVDTSMLESPPAGTVLEVKLVPVSKIALRLVQSI